MTLPATPDDDRGATVRYVPVSEILTDAARARARALDERNWAAVHDEWMRRICG